MPRPVLLEPGDRVLVSRTDRVGDLLLALPLIETLKTRYPECRVEVMASAYAAPVLKNNPYIDDIVTVDPALLKTEKGYSESTRNDLENRAYRAALVVYPEKVISQLLFRVGIPNRIGTIRRRHFYYFNRFLFHSRKKSNKHESEYNQDFLAFFRDGPIIRRPHVYIIGEEKQSAASLLSSLGLGGNRGFVVLHPGTGGSAFDWPLDRFFELYNNLTVAGIKAVMTGSRAESVSIATMAAKQGMEILSLAGKTDLRLLTAVLSRASLTIANSTGPLHLAAATGRRVIGLYPDNRVMSPRRWGPLGEGHCVFQPPSGGNMEDIAAREVGQKVLDMLKIKHGEVV